jgi:hypothetical protein
MVSLIAAKTIDSLKIQQDTGSENICFIVEK